MVRGLQPPHHRLLNACFYAGDVARLQDLNSIARALAGSVRHTDRAGWYVTAPGPGQKRRDRSLSIWLREDGDIRVHSHRDQDIILCKDYVRAMAGLPSWQERQQTRRLETIGRKRARENHRRKRMRAMRAQLRPLPLSKRRPWEAAGMSRATWYRRAKPEAVRQLLPTYTKLPGRSSLNRELGTVNTRTRERENTRTRDHRARGAWLWRKREDTTHAADNIPHSDVVRVSSVVKCLAVPSPPPR